MICSIAIDADLQSQIAREAKAAFPRECCGLIEGVREGDRIVATALHTTRNIASDAGCFEIDPAAQIALLKQLRGTKREIVGCYHSHPNGYAEPSARDGEAAVERGFIWLIQAADLRGFIWTGGGFAEVALVMPAIA